RTSASPTSAWRSPPVSPTTSTRWSRSSAPARNPVAGAQRGQLPGVVAQDLPLRDVVERLQLDGVVERTGHALDMRPVRAEDHAVGTHQLDGLVDVVLPERVDPDVAPERRHRILGEPPGKLRPAERSLWNRSPRNSEPFSTDAMRTLGKRSKSLSKIS